MKYEIGIVNSFTGDGIHHEMGHFLLNVKDSGGETKNRLEAPIIRQASIPRANSMMTTGTLKIGSVQDAITQGASKIYSAKPESSDSALQALIDAEFTQKRDEVLAGNGPELDDPLAWLETKIGLSTTTATAKVDWVFEFRNDKAPSEMASGQRVVNPVSVGHLLSDFWIGDRESENGTIEILQYAQIVDLFFHGINWPHMAVNTLIKQP